MTSRRAAEGVDAFHLVAVHGAPGQIAARLGRVWRGRALGEDCAREARMRRACIATATGGFRYFVDGDLQPASERVDVETGPLVDLLR